MSGADIVALQRDDPFPPAQVLDLAVSVAIGRELAASESEMFERIEDWFLRPATRAELKASVSRLIDRGWIHRSNDDDDFDLCLTDAGVEAATTLSGGMIRMIDRGRGLIQTSFLQSLDLAQGKCP